MLRGYGVSLPACFCRPQTLTACCNRKRATTPRQTFRFVWSTWHVSFLRLIMNCLQGESMRAVVDRPISDDGESLTFRTGDIIHNVQRIDDARCIGEIGGQVSTSVTWALPLDSIVSVYSKDTFSSPMWSRLIRSRQRRRLTTRPGATTTSRRILAACPCRQTLTRESTWKTFAVDSDACVRMIGLRAVNTLCYVVLHIHCIRAPPTAIATASGFACIFRKRACA